jgi:hypothetical protein
MKHSFDWRDVSVTRTQSMRHLDQYPWAPRPMINWPSMKGMFVTLALVLAVYGLWVSLP